MVNSDRNPKFEAELEFTKDYSNQAKSYNNRISKRRKKNKIAKKSKRKNR